MTTPTVEDIVEDAVYNLVQELETTDCQDSDGIFRQDAYDVIRAHLTTYGNARFEEGVKAERERIVVWANRYTSKHEHACINYHDLIAHLQSDK